MKKPVSKEIAVLEALGIHDWVEMPQPYIGRIISRRICRQCDRVQAHYSLGSEKIAWHDEDEQFTTAIAKDWLKANRS